MYKAEDYTYRVFWSDEDEEFVGTVAEFPSLSCLDTEQINAFIGIVGVVKESLDILGKEGRAIPEPLNKRQYSGKFALRMTPEQHKRLAIEAAEQNISINQLLVSRI